MRFQEKGLPLTTRQTVLTVLSGVPLPDDMPKKSCLLYCCENKAAFAASMPSFDEWGPRPISLVGPRENPVDVVPFLAAGAELAPGDGAGKRAVSEAGGSGAEEHTSGGDSRRRPRGPAAPLLRCRLPRRCDMRLPRLRLQEPREVAGRRS